MSCIILDGIVLYIFIAFVISLVLISLGCILYAILCDKREIALVELLNKERIKTKVLAKQNLILKIKSGELNIDEK